MQYSSSQYGETLYGTIEKNRLTPEELEPDLMKYLPPFLKEDEAMQQLQQLFQKELGHIKFSLYEVLDQCFIDTATWGMELWEKFVGIPVDKAKHIEYRRAAVKSKIRGAGTVTKTMLMQVASAYSGGEVEIIEQPEKSSFIVKFVGTKGTPPNMMDLTKTIENIKPAHMVFEYKYNFAVWDWMGKYSWNQVQALSWERARREIES